MTEYIKRFLGVRGVIKNVYLQIYELQIFLEDRQSSLGYYQCEGYSAFLQRSHDPYTHTFGFNREDYVTEVKEIYGMQLRVELKLDHIRDIYFDLLDILKCNVELREDILHVQDDPDNNIEDIVKMLQPGVSLDGLDEVMETDQRLTLIVERIYVVIFQGNPMDSFELTGKSELGHILRDLITETGEAIEVKDRPVNYVDFLLDHRSSGFLEDRGVYHYASYLCTVYE
jgi:hypothetical protein